MIRKPILALGTFMTVFLASGIAFANEAAAAAGAAASDGRGLVALAAAFAISFAAIAGTTAQGRAAANALDGIARNPGAAGPMFLPLILALALIESLVIFSLLVAFQLAGKV